jgi:hypothetical protein
MSDVSKNILRCPTVVADRSARSLFIQSLCNRINRIAFTLPASSHPVQIKHTSPR